MRNVATWIRPKDEKWFRRAFAPHPDVRLWNALHEEVPMEKMDGLLLSGGPDIAQEFLRQPVPDGPAMPPVSGGKGPGWAAAQRRVPAQRQAGGAVRPNGYPPTSRTVGSG